MRQCKLRKAGYDVDVAVVQKSHALCWSQRQLGVRRLYVTGTTQTSALLPRREEGGGGRGRRRSLGVWLRRRRRIMVVKLLAGEWEAVKEALWPDVSRNVFGFFLIKLNKTHAVKPFYSCQLEYWGFKRKDFGDSAYVLQCWTLYILVFLKQSNMTEEVQILHVQ